MSQVVADAPSCFFVYEQSVRLSSWSSARFEPISLCDIEKNKNEETSSVRELNVGVDQQLAVRMLRNIGGRNGKGETLRNKYPSLFIHFHDLLD